VMARNQLLAAKARLAELRKVAVAVRRNGVEHETADQ